MKPPKKKRYVLGGEVQGYQTPAKIPKAKAKALKDSSFGEIASDAALTLADQGLSKFGAENVIKGKNYSTKLGQQINDKSQILNSIERQATTGILNYLAPGAGTAYSATTSGVGNLVGADSSISANTQKDISGINQVGTGINSVLQLGQFSQENPSGIFKKPATKTDLPVEKGFAEGGLLELDDNVIENNNKEHYNNMIKQHGVDKASQEYISFFGKKPKNYSIKKK
jgi:hypothetical protein